MVSVWRVHIRPFGGARVDYAGSYDLCVRKNVIGIGWQIASRETYSDVPLSLSDYLREAAEAYPDGVSWKTAINRLRDMNQNDLVWIRSPRPNRYHLCRIVGPWDYRGAREYRELDVVNVRPVEMIEVEPQAVPREIEMRFIGGSTIEPIRNQSQVDATIELWSRYNAD
jgi:hypothetical protein